MIPVLMTVLEFLPYIFILWLANMAERQRAEGKSGTALAVITYVILVMNQGSLVLIGLLLQVTGTLAKGNPALQSAFATLPAGMAEALPAVGLALWLPTLVGLILVLPPVRKLLAHLIPIDPASTVHAVSLSFAMLIPVQLGAMMALGLGNLASLLETSSGTAGLDANAIISTLWAQELTWFVMAFIGVGLLSRRNLRQSLERLAITRLTWGRVAAGLGIGVALACLVLGALYVMSLAGLTIDKDVEKLSQLLVGPLGKSAFGIITIGLAAAIGEEAIFRAALQPRFGLLLTAVCFVLLHAQYGLSLATGAILVVALVLGLVRKGMNTSTSMIVHATYNITVSLLPLLGLFGQ